MTVIGAISQLNAVKPNGYGQNEKIKWLSILDGKIKAEIIDTHEGADPKTAAFKGYTNNTLMEELLVSAPYDDIYVKWLEAQVDYANGEYKRYNVSSTMFNEAYDAFVKWYNRTHLPISKGYTRF